MDNVKLVGHTILSGGGMWPLSQELIDETEMVSSGYLGIAYISVGPWQHGPLRASSVRDAHSSLSTAFCLRLLKPTCT